MHVSVPAVFCLGETYPKQIISRRCKEKSKIDKYQLDYVEENVSPFTTTPIVFFFFFNFQLE